MTEKPQFKLVSCYGVQAYFCGLKAGDKVTLKHDIIIRFKNGQPSGEIRREGEEWIVLSGSADDPGIVWLRNAEGERWTWDDSARFFQTFELKSSEQA